MRKIFCCYSVDLRNYLYQNGIKYDLWALNTNSNNMFWSYIRTKELDKKLTEWSNAKKR